MLKSVYTFIFFDFAVRLVLVGNNFIAINIIMILVVFARTEGHSLWSILCDLFCLLYISVYN